MKFPMNFVFSALLIVLLAGHLHGGKIHETYSKGKTKLSESLKNESSFVRASIDTLKANAKDLNPDSASIALIIKLSLELSSKIVPLPIRPLVGLAASIFSSYYNSSLNKKDTVTSNQLSLEIKELGRVISYESQRIIDEIKRAIVEHTVKHNLQDTLDSLDGDWDKYSRCFLTDDCPKEVKLDAYNQLLIPSSHFRTKLEHFVTSYINQRKNEREIVYAMDGFFTFALDDCKNMAKRDKDCNGKNGQAVINRYFMKIMATISRSYGMIVLANMIRYREHQIANRTDEARRQLRETMYTIQTFHSDVKTIVRETHITLAQTSNLIRPCDPEKHIKHETYDYFRHLYIGYFGKRFHWRDMATERDDSIQHFGECGHPRVFVHLLTSCEDHVPLNWQSNTVYYKQEDRERMCDHAVISGNRMGPWDETHKGFRHQDFGMRNFNPSNNFYFCSAEFILDKPDKWEKGQYPQRFVSLRAVEASPNHAITGIRWKFYDGILFPEIQQGEYSNGLVNRSSVHWKPTDTDDPIYVTLGRKYGKALGFNLDDVLLPDGYFLTGFKFDFDSNKSAHQMIRMKIQGEHLSGSCIKSDWISMKPWSKNIRQLPLDGSDVSEKAANNSLLSKSGEHYVHLQTTGQEKDFSQTTIPYIDIQPIESQPPQPLVGVGIHYKSFMKLGGGYGGFMGLHLFHRNYSEVIRPDKIENYIEKIDTLFAGIENQKLSVDDLEKLWDGIQEQQDRI